jgi:hypothetical protein
MFGGQSWGALAMRQATMLRWIEEADARRVCALERERLALGIGASPHLERGHVPVFWTMASALFRSLRRSPKDGRLVGQSDGLSDGSGMS